MNHKSHAHVVKQNFSTVLQIISPEMHRGGLEMAITYAHLYCGIATPVERDVRCCRKNYAIASLSDTYVSVLARVMWRGDACVVKTWMWPTDKDPPLRRHHMSLSKIKEWPETFSQFLL